MKAVYAWVANIAFASIGLFVLKQVLPEGSLKRYANMIMGIVLVCVIFSPLARIDTESIFEKVLSDFEKIYVLDKYDAKSVSTESNNSNYALKLTEKYINEDVYKFLKSIDCDVYMVSVELDNKGNVTQIFVLLNKVNSLPYETIDLLNKRYGIKNDRIIVERRDIDEEQQ